MERLCGEVSSLKSVHQDELSRLLEAQVMVEETLQQECNEVVRKLEAATEVHQQALSTVTTRAEVLLAGIDEMDDLIACKLF